MGVDHPFEHRAHYNGDGEVCHCPWGFDEGGEHLGSAKESSKLDWLRERPDMQTPEGRAFLKYLNAEGYTKADKLLPWLAREWKQNRAILPRDHEFAGESIPDPITYRDGSGEPRSFTPEEAVQTQKNLEEMKLRHQGLDVMQHKMHELLPKVQDFQDWKDSKGRENMGTILHTFPDGWTVRLLESPDEYADEGERMGHCIGDNAGNNDYWQQGSQEAKYHVSLRDHKNLPHATAELEPPAWGNPIDADTIMNEFYGKGDMPPKYEYVKRMEDWLGSQGVPTPLEWGEADPGELELYRERMDQPNIYNAPVTAAVSKPLYHRWVFSPSKGVTIGTNSDDHPALVKYHQGLGSEINDTDLVHGYAYPIGNGWRLTDYEHQAVEDPYIINQVVRRLNGEDGALRTAEGSSWHLTPDYDRLHYAMPLPQD